MKIEKSIPVPRNQSFPYITQWRDVAALMENGDSILTEDRDDASSLLRAINNRKCGLYGRCQKVSGEGYRVWASKEPGKGAKIRAAKISPADHPKR